MNNPEQVLETLLAKVPRPQKRENLQLIHRICSAQARGSCDFSLGTIGRLCEAAGGMKARTIYNAPSADFRALIKSWSDASAGEPHAKTAKLPDDSSLLSRIGDPALRTLMQGVLIERDRLRAELHLLKSGIVLRLDRRTSGAPPGSQPHAQPPNKLALAPSEREAVERAVSATFFASEGWHEGKAGEVFNGRGRRLYEVGYTRALRRLLEL